jgi:hypothetical protein
MEIKDLAAIQEFEFDRLLNEGKFTFCDVLSYSYLGSDPVTATLTLLGTFPETRGAIHRVPAILRIERTPLSRESAGDLCSTLLHKVQLVGNNDIVRYS